MFPNARVTIMAGKELLDFYLPMTKWLDDNSGILADLPIGCRLIELPAFERSFFKFVYNFERDWKLVLPNLYQFLLLEGDRAERLELVTERATFIT